MVDVLHSIPSSILEKIVDRHGNAYTYLGRLKKSVGSSGDFWFVKFNCKAHGDKVQRQDGHIRGAKCDQCALEDSATRSSLSFSDFLDRVHPDNRGKYLYLGLHRKAVKEKGKLTVAVVTLKCSSGHVYEARATNHINAPVGCGICSNALEHEEGYGIVNSVSVVGYKRFATCSCPEHGEFTTPRYKVKGKTAAEVCPKCALSARNLALIQPIEDVVARVSNSGTGLTLTKSTYVSVSKPAEFTCENGHKSYKLVSQVVSEGKGCKYCSSTISSFNLAIAKLITDLGFECEKEYKFSGTKSYDVYVPAKKLAIDYHGNIWHSTKYKRDTGSHLERLKLSEALGITYIQIFSDEWRDRNAQVIARIKHLLGLSRKVPARTCAVVEISKAEANSFLDKHHVQGGVSAGNLCLGLTDSTGTLVAVMVVGANVSSRSATDDLEMLRYATAVCVVGGLSKLLARVRSLYNGRTLVTYGDRRMFSGASYTSVGFNLLALSKPDYRYITASDDTRLHKSNFTKERIAHRFGIAIEGKTEFELAESLGYYRIYDAGKSKWGMTL
jgi:hypothetical protein